MPIDPTELPASAPWAAWTQNGAWACTLQQVDRRGQAAVPS